MIWRMNFMNDVNSMKYSIDYISGIMSLRNPQEKSLQILDDILKSTNLMNEYNQDNINNLKVINSKYPIFTEFERAFTSLTFALATGVGKTRLMVHMDINIIICCPKVMPARITNTASANNTRDRDT